MRENKLKFIPGNFDHGNWIVIYRIFRAAKRGRTLKLIGSRTPEQLIVALLLGEHIPQRVIERHSRMMKAAKKVYFDSSCPCMTFGYPLDENTFYGDIHHEFGTFTTELASCRNPEHGIEYKEMLKNDMDEYRKDHGLPPVKWKGKK